MIDKEAKMDEKQETEECEAEVKELLISLIEDIFDLILAISEDKSNKVFNMMFETKEDALRAVKNVVGGIVLSPDNYKRIAKVTARIVKVTASIAKLSTKYISVNVNVK